MRIIRAIKNRISAKDKGIGARAAVSIFMIVSFLGMFCIPHGNGYPELWFFMPFGIFLAFVWRIGRTHVRMSIATLILALTIVLTFGFTGAQQTSEFMKTGGWGNSSEHFVNIQLTHQGETRTIQAQVTKADLLRLIPADEVVCEYRTVSLFGLHLWTAIDSVDSAPVIGAGSRNASSNLLAWFIVLWGALPLIYMVVAIRRSRRNRDPSVIAKIDDEAQKSTAPS